MEQGGVLEADISELALRTCLSHGYASFSRVVHKASTFVDSIARESQDSIALIHQRLDS